MSIGQRRLGRTGLKVSEVSLGTMAFGRWIDEKASAEVLDTALDSGVTLIDTADVYGSGMDKGNPLETGESETILGNLLGARRHEIVLATKVHGRVGLGPNDAGQSRYHIERAIDNSLRRLQTDYIDLYQVHRFDEETPLEETLRALDDLVRKGKVRYIGASNYAAWQIAKAHGISARLGLERYESIQPEYSLIARGIEQEILPLAASEGVGVIVYSPLGRGLLTGKYSYGGQPPVGTRGAAGEQRLKVLLEQERNFRIVEQLKPLAERRGWTLGQLALNWVLSQPAITSAILGISKPQHITEALPVLGEKLDREELKQIDAITSGTQLELIAR
ncbi:aldo/keto reductase [Paenibacillus qinlingensis]|uniref:Aryl-alcohol dehydrogenase-like predicted oxidoreductase n=1 Tax=Paenibacillus qinlingensis TaxID=1837343 RepID=A0ABU1NSW8_9BACL|nr:aldo/keto reductase [Paenibacillus qinlingensis]MDR6550544.1 aryl-alcohol dehydrogenase-like predicted oxidoreductase [Paenibacillus qinlingensis]